MKKQNFKSLTLKRNTVSNLEQGEITGGISGGACESHGNSECCPSSFDVSCRLTDQRTCVNSILYCNG